MAEKMSGWFPRAGKKSAEQREELVSPEDRSESVEEAFHRGFNETNFNRPVENLVDSEKSKFKIGEPFYFGNKSFVVSNVETTSGSEPVYSLTARSPDGERYTIKKTESRLEAAAQRSRDYLSTPESKVVPKEADKKPGVTPTLKEKKTIRVPVVVEDKKSSTPAPKENIFTNLLHFKDKEIPVASSEVAQAALHGWEHIQARWAALSPEQQEVIGLRLQQPNKESKAPQKIYSIGETDSKERLVIVEKNAHRQEIPTTYEVYLLNPKGRRQDIKNSEELVSILRDLEAKLPAEVPPAEPQPVAVSKPEPVITDDTENTVVPEASAVPLEVKVPVKTETLKSPDSPLEQALADQNFSLNDFKAGNKIRFYEKSGNGAEALLADIKEQLELDVPIDKERLTVKDIEIIGEEEQPNDALLTIRSQEKTAIIALLPLVRAGLIRR